MAKAKKTPKVEADVFTVIHGGDDADIESFIEAIEAVVATFDGVGIVNTIPLDDDVDDEDVDDDEDVEDEDDDEEVDDDDLDDEDDEDGEDEDDEDDEDEDEDDEDEDDEDDESEEEWTEEELRKLKIGELRAVARDYEIDTKGKSKDDIINAMLYEDE